MFQSPPVTLPLLTAHPDIRPSLLTCQVPASPSNPGKLQLYGMRINLESRPLATTRILVVQDLSNHNILDFNLTDLYNQTKAMILHWNPVNHSKASKDPPKPFSQNRPHREALWPNNANSVLVNLKMVVPWNRICCSPEQALFWCGYPVPIAPILYMLSIIILCLLPLCIQSLKVMTSPFHISPRVLSSKNRKKRISSHQQIRTTSKLIIPQLTPNPRLSLNRLCQPSQL